MGRNSKAKKQTKHLEKLERRLHERTDFAKALERIQKVQAISEGPETRFRNLGKSTVGTWTLAEPPAEEYTTD